MFVSHCASDFYGRIENDVWVNEHTFDYSHLDRYMAGFRRIDPQALVMPQIMLTLPRWWEERRPNELQRFHDGGVHAQFYGAPIADVPRDQVVSLASEQWSADMTMCLKKYLDYAEANYGDRIAGYLIGGGITCEWGLLGSFDFIDYSEPMRRYWREWALKQYDGSPPYDSACIPSRDLRLLADGSFRNLAQSQAAIDFQRCLSDLTVARIIGFCETVKQHKTARRKVVATYYGYTLTCREGGLDCHNQFLGRYGCGGFQGGHLAMRKLLQSPAVDMISSPFSYHNRRLGVGDFQPHYAENSVLRNGKASFLQDDNRSWKGESWNTIDLGYYPEPENFLRQLRRSFARRLCGDDLVYYADISGGNYDDQRILQEMRRLQDKFEAYAPLRAAAEAEILIVVDERAVACLGLASGLQYQNVYLQSSQWALAGTPYHVMLLDDAAAVDLAAYPLIVLTNTICVSAELEQLVARARAADSSLLFLPGSGLVGAGGLDVRAAAQLTGLQLELFSCDERCLNVRYNLDGECGGYGNERPLSHLLTVADAGVEILSVIEGDGRPALAFKPRAGAYELSHKNIIDQPAAVWRIQDAFGKTKAHWHPYWRNAAFVSSNSEQVKVSFWNRPAQGVLLVASNLGADEIDAAIDVKWSKLGYRGKLDSLDMLPFADAAMLANNFLKAKLPPGKCRIIYAAPPAVALWPKMRKARQWVEAMFQKRIAETKFDQWLVVGPFGDSDPTPYIPPNARRPETPPDFNGMETVYAPEAWPIKPDASFETAGGKPCVWTKAVAENGDLEFPKCMLREKWDCAYAYTRICFPTLVPSLPENPVELHFRSHHAFKIWINGKEVYSYGGAGTPRYGQKALLMNEHAIKISLHPGWNDLLVKMVARAGSNFKYALSGFGGEAIPPLLIEAQAPKD